MDVPTRRMGIASIGAIFLASLAMPVFGCSVAMCGGGGIEIVPDATIKVIHQGRPLAGASITISRSGPDDKTVFTGKTDVNGSLNMSRLTPGEYWLNVEFLGISAAYHCFHVRSRPSWRSKRKLKYKWGDWATATLHHAGELLDSQPGTGDNALLNQINRIAVPIVGAEVTLQDPRTGEVMRTNSGEGGTFSFSDARQVVYVLRIAGGKMGRSYEPTSMVVKRAAIAPLERLHLQRVEGCGAPSLSLVSPRR